LMLRRREPNIIVNIRVIDGKVIVFPCLQLHSILFLQTLAPS
jgi:hypothetical protein